MQISDYNTIYRGRREAEMMISVLGGEGMWSGKALPRQPGAEGKRSGSGEGAGKGAGKLLQKDHACIGA